MSKISSPERIYSSRNNMFVRVWDKVSTDEERPDFFSVPPAFISQLTDTWSLRQINFSVFISRRRDKFFHAQAAWWVRSQFQLKVGDWI